MNRPDACAEGPPKRAAEPAGANQTPKGKTRRNDLASQVSSAGRLNRLRKWALRGWPLLMAAVSLIAAIAIATSVHAGPVGRARAAYAEMK